MVKTPLNILLIYGLVGLAIAGGVVTVSEVTSKVVPVFPRNGQLGIDLILSSSTTDPSTTAYSPSKSNGHYGENYTLRMTTDSVMVYRRDTFNLTGGWATLEGGTRSLTLRTGVKIHFGGVTLPEGNVTIVRVKVVDVTLQRIPEGAWENIIGVQNGEIDITTHARVKAQTTTDVLVDFRLACPAPLSGIVPNTGEQGWCSVTPSAENED